MQSGPQGVGCCLPVQSETGIFQARQAESQWETEPFIPLTNPPPKNGHSRSTHIVALSE